jgi:hypothetical protein
LHANLQISTGVHKKKSEGVTTKTRVKTTHAPAWHCCSQPAPLITATRAP